MILTWLNTNNGCLYSRFCNSYILNNYYIGFKNSYGHEVVQILIIRDNKLYNVQDYSDYVYQTSNLKKKQRYNIFKMFIHKLQEFTS